VSLSGLGVVVKTPVETIAVQVGLGGCVGDRAAHFRSRHGRARGECIAAVTPSKLDLFSMVYLYG
jgi:hypothetical protein